MDIKQIRLYDENTGEVGNPKSIVPIPEDILFSDNTNLAQKINNIFTSINSKASSVHKHVVTDITNFPTKLSAFMNDTNFVTKDDISATTHTHANKIILDTITQTMLNGFADKYTKTEIDNKILNLQASDKNLYAAKVHTHKMADLLDYIPPNIPTKTSQLNNDSGYITKDYISSLNINTNTLHTHTNKIILDSITQTMLNGFADKYTKTEIDNKLRDIAQNTGALTLDDVTAKVNEIAALKSHSHVISDIEDLQDTLDNKSPTNHIHAIENITNLQKSLDGKASSTHTHSTTDILGLNNHVHLNKDILDAITQKYLNSIQKRPTDGLQGQIPFIGSPTSNPDDGTVYTDYTNDYILKKVNLVENNAELDDAKSIKINFSDVFNNWTRISHQNGVTAQPGNPAELNNWVLDSVNNKVICNVNSASYIGFVSKEKYNDYLHEVTLSSTNSDDDFIAVILAFAKDSNGVEHTISAIRSRCGNPLWQLVYDFQQSTAKVITSKNKLLLDDIDYSDGVTATNTPLVGWDKVPNGTRIYVNRTGNIFTVKCSPFNSTTYDEDSTFTLDLSSDSKYSIFIGPTQYGYACMSQDQSTFSNINFVSGSDNTIYDTSTGKIYNKVNNVWVEDTSTDIVSQVGIGHFAYNENTHKLFYIHESGTIKSLNSGMKYLNVNGMIQISQPDVGSGKVTGITGSIANSDLWRVVGGDNGSDNGYLEIATTDNGNEPIYVRQYSGGGVDFTTLVRTLALLDANGNTKIPGVLYIGEKTITQVIEDVLRSHNLIS